VQGALVARRNLAVAILLAKSADRTARSRAVICAVWDSAAATARRRLSTVAGLSARRSAAASCSRSRWTWSSD
jgi:hypothetical protein